VLLADERVDMRETIAFHLAMAGFPVVQAGSLDAVVDELHRGRPDVVVVADDLGGTPVEDLLVTITEQPELDGVPVITLSEDPTSGRLAACLALGARDHVRRQAGAEELIARIDAVLRVDDELERLRQRNAELEFLAAIDPLTGMANRRGVEEELDRLVAGAIRHHLPLSAVMARVDGLRPGGPRRRDRAPCPRDRRVAGPGGGRRRRHPRLSPSRSGPPCVERAGGGRRQPVTRAPPLCRWRRTLRPECPSAARPRRRWLPSTPGCGPPSLRVRASGWHGTAAP